jgi:hypothetical protein
VDIFLTAYSRGEPATRDGTAVRELLEARLAEGSAEVRGMPDGAPIWSGMRFGEVSGDDVLDLIVEAAILADLVITPAGGPTCVVSEDQRGQLPPGLDAVLVRSGADLRRVIAA